MGLDGLGAFSCGWSRSACAGRAGRFHPRGGAVNRHFFQQPVGHAAVVVNALGAVEPVKGGHRSGAPAMGGARQMTKMARRA